MEFNSIYTKGVIGYSHPQELEMAKTTVYLRFNITKIQDEHEQDCWKYDELQMTYPEYRAWQKRMTEVDYVVLSHSIKNQEDAIVELAELIGG